jgi:hypothetical protein
MNNNNTGNSNFNLDGGTLIVNGGFTSAIDIDNSNVELAIRSKLSLLYSKLLIKSQIV